MKIFLWWSRESGLESEPHAGDAGAPVGDTCYVASLLTDDGGFGYQKTVRETMEVQRAIAEIRAGRREAFCWHRETFAAEIFPDKVKISFQYIEEYYDVMTLDEFERVLTAWYVMLVKGAEESYSKIEIEIHPVLVRPAG